MSTEENAVPLSERLRGLSDEATAKGAPDIALELAMARHEAARLERERDETRRERDTLRSDRREHARAAFAAWCVAQRGIYVGAEASTDAFLACWDGLLKIAGEGTGCEIGDRLAEAEKERDAAIRERDEARDLLKHVTGLSLYDFRRLGGLLTLKHGDICRLGRVWHDSTAVDTRTAQDRRISDAISGRIGAAKAEQTPAQEEVGREVKCITFDHEAQAAIPPEIRAKMDADRRAAEEEMDRE